MLPNAPVTEIVTPGRRIPPFYLALCVIAAWTSYAAGMHLWFNGPISMAAFPSISGKNLADSEHSPAEKVETLVTAKVAWTNEETPIR